MKMSRPSKYDLIISMTVVIVIIILAGINQ